MASDLSRLDATDQAALVRSREVSPLELVDSAIERITTLNPDLNAVIWERFEQARAEARTVSVDGAFAGVPLLLKDLGCPAAGEPDHQGSRFLKESGHLGDHDCAIVRRFKQAGFIILGRTNVPEFGLVSDTSNSAYGPTRNPWNTTVTPGGSSGGSSAAVAAGMVAIAHGNDGGGSLRIPASHTGLIGLKPSRGRVSHAPDAGDPMLGHVTSGVLTKSVRDTANAFDVLAGSEPGDPCVPPMHVTRFADAVSDRPSRLRVGFVAQPGGSRWTTDPWCVRAVGTAASWLQEFGHQVDESHPGALVEEEFWARWFDALSPTITSAVEWAKGLNTGKAADFDPITNLWANRGKAMSARELVETLNWLDGYRRRMASWWADGYDILLCPVFLSPPPVIGSFWSYPDGIADSVTILRFTPQFNTTGQPAISVPVLWTDQNLPVGVQLIAAYGREDLLLNVAAQIEAAHPWSHRYPLLGTSSSPESVR
jgi:amidase